MDRPNSFILLSMAGVWVDFILASLIFITLNICVQVIYKDTGFHFSWVHAKRTYFGGPIRALLEKEMATHSSTLAWKIPWMEEPGRLQSMGSQRVGHD